ncbi:hypothetical protein Tco_0772157 [Tanacetum coccineum]|uniref:Uncharacterized protein n=1 Tax=Tanacetum coccineum TaxID=301880 RepID=A0ABQ4ZJP1_9ASTR
MLVMTKPDVIKVVQGEAEKIRLDPKAIKGAKAGKMFKKAEDAEHAVLKRQHTEKVRKSLELRKHKGNDGRNFEVHEPFLFGSFGISELDELREIIPKKKNAMPLNKPHPDPQERNGSTWNLSLKQESLDWNAIELSLKMSRSSTTWSLKNLIAASMVKSHENARFSMKLRKLIAEHPKQEKLKSKKAKLEALGYKMD